MVGKPRVCSHGILGVRNCRECHNEIQQRYYWRNREKVKARSREFYQKNRQIQRERLRRKYQKYAEKYREYQRERRKKGPEKIKIYDLIGNHPERYPLDTVCVFCGETKDLEHGHLDYEDEGYNYLTVCPSCNRWMEKPIEFY